jgi:thioredoxin-dependent peroxiredoxin
MTPGCTAEACDFTSARTPLDAGGYVVLGISPDKPEKLAKFRDKEELTITLLSDADRSVMTAYGAYGEKKMYGKTVQGVIRSTFVVGADGRLEQAWRNVKATGHVARVLSELGLAS